MSDEWFVQLTCCGRDDGIYVAPSWREADEFREVYIDAGGHDRSAIIVGNFATVDTEGEPT